MCVYIYTYKYTFDGLDSGPLPSETTRLWKDGGPGISSSESSSTSEKYINCDNIKKTISCRLNKTV